MGKTEVYSSLRKTYENDEAVKGLISLLKQSDKKYSELERLHINPMEGYASTS